MKQIESFHSQLEKYENKLYNFHVKVPDVIVNSLKSKGVKRFLCSINNGDTFHASLIPAGAGQYFIKVNKELRKKNHLAIGSPCAVTLYQDTSEYGIQLPEEMKELLFQDPEGDLYFHKLTPGKQRSLLFIVDKIKSPEKRLEKSLIIINHLKEQKGSLDFKILHQDFKSKRGLF